MLKDHFFKLTTFRKQGKEFSLFAHGDQILFASNLYTALSFNTVEEKTNTDEAKKLSNYEVVILKHANFSVYLNYPQKISEETAKY